MEAAAAGELELNVMEPVIARHLLGSLHEVTRVPILFAECCVSGLRWNTDALHEHRSGSLEAVVARVADVGYSHVGDPGGPVR